MTTKHPLCICETGHHWRALGGLRCPSCDGWLRDPTLHGNDEGLKAIRKFIGHGWGKRCETKDTDDFPELKEDHGARCACCAMWEAYDEYVEFLKGDTQ